MDAQDLCSGGSFFLDFRDLTDCLFQSVMRLGKCGRADTAYSFAGKIGQPGFQTILASGRRIIAIIAMGMDVIEAGHDAIFTKIAIDLLFAIIINCFDLFIFDLDLSRDESRSNIDSFTLNYHNLNHLSFLS